MLLERQGCRLDHGGGVSGGGGGARLAYRQHDRDGGGSRRRPAALHGDGGGIDSRRQAVGVCRHGEAFGTGGGGGSRHGEPRWRRSGNRRPQGIAVGRGDVEGLRLHHVAIRAHVGEGIDQAGADRNSGGCPSAHEQIDVDGGGRSAGRSDDHRALVGSAGQLVRRVGHREIDAGVGTGGQQALRGPAEVVIRQEPVAAVGSSHLEVVAGRARGAVLEANALRAGSTRRDIAEGRIVDVAGRASQRQRPTARGAAAGAYHK